MSTATGSATVAAQPAGFRRFWRALKQLFHEVTGAIFGVLGLAWLNLAFRSWTRDVAHWLIAIAAAVALLFLFFALTAFRKSRNL